MASDSTPIADLRRVLKIDLRHPLSPSPESSAMSAKRGSAAVIDGSGPLGLTEGESLFSAKAIPSEPRLSKCRSGRSISTRTPFDAVRRRLDLQIGGYTSAEWLKDRRGRTFVGGYGQYKKIVKT